MANADTQRNSASDKTTSGDQRKQAERAQQQRGYSRLRFFPVCQGKTKCDAVRKGRGFTFKAAGQRQNLIALLCSTYNY